MPLVDRASQIRRSYAAVAAAIKILAANRRASMGPVRQRAHPSAESPGRPPKPLLHPPFAADRLKADEDSARPVPLRVLPVATTPRLACGFDLVPILSDGVPALCSER